MSLRNLMLVALSFMLFVLVALTAPLTFGEFQQTTPPREMQFALRYEF